MQIEQTAQAPDQFAQEAAVLARFSAGQAAIAAEVKKLSVSIAEFLAAQSRMTDAELAPGADGGKEAATLRKARSEVEAAGRAIDEASERLTRWRAKLASEAAALAAAHASVQQRLPDYHRELLEAFRPAWESAAAEWSRALGERAALERLIGAPLDLQEPAAEAVELPAEIGAPMTLLAELEKAVARLAADARASRGIVYPPGQIPPPPVGPRDVFVTVGDRFGTEAGMLVVAASFPEGQLQRMLANRRVVPAGPAEVARRDAEKALRDIESARREAAAAADAEAQKKARAERDEEWRRRDPQGWRKAKEEAQEEAERAERYQRNQEAAMAAKDAEWDQRIERYKRQRERRQQEAAATNPVGRMLQERREVEQSIG